MVRLVLLLVVLLAASAVSQTHVVIAWNDLGMHCSNKNFGGLVVLPPFNNVTAQVIKVGDASHLPQVVTDGLKISYEIPGNTYSVGKTDFWSFEDQIFGVNLPDNVGLTGNGLTGWMSPLADHFSVTGIPITPYTDADLAHEDAFQLGLLKLYDNSDNLLATTQPVVPVSNEINCISSGCHTSESALLNQHDRSGGFDPANTPILCASCHSSNALGTPGHPGVPSLSEAVHKAHGDRTNDCYKCHPGPTTQCLRDVMKNRHGFTCQTCHGSVKQVGESISSGRNPWLQEPSCGAGACHGSQFGEEPGKLFRQSKGHGGLFCSACHGEPHAIVPSSNPRDNLMQVSLQGFAGTLKKCEVCHGVTPTGAGPHGIYASNCCVGLTGNVDCDPENKCDISDLSALIDNLYISFAPLCCQAEANVDGQSGIDISDLSALIDYLYISFTPPAACQ